MVRRLIVGAAASASLLLAAQQPAAPCGVKLTVKAPKVKREVARSDNPSYILMLGDSSRKTAAHLKAAGHEVDVADSPGAAPRSKYDVIIAQGDEAKEAHQRWPSAIIVQPDGKSNEVAQRVEDDLKRNPTRVAEARTPKETGPERGAPTRTGGSTFLGKRLTGTGGAETTAPPGPSADAAPTREAREARATPARERKPKIPPPTEKAKTRVAEATPEPKADDLDQGKGSSDTSAPEEKGNPEKPDMVGAPKGSAGNGKVASHIFFDSGAFGLTAKYKAKLDQTARWLVANPDKSITVDGHASATGAHDRNMELSNNRAEAVKSYLVEKGVDASRITTNGYGQERPEFQPPNNPRNRRVIITVN